MCRILDKLAYTAYKLTQFLKMDFSAYKLILNKKNNLAMEINFPVKIITFALT